MLTSEPLAIQSTRTLFAFDDLLIPGLCGVELQMCRPEKHPLNPIVPRGKDGEPGRSQTACPAVLREGNRWRMWYAANDDTGADGMRVAYAESDDGMHWHKPDLGLVEYCGSRHNNLVDAQPGFNSVSVLFDPDTHQYVMAGEDMCFWNQGEGWSLAGPANTRIDVSDDGFHWTPVQDHAGLIIPQNETITIYQFDGYYHLGGHQISPLLRLPMQEHELGAYLGPRTFVVWRSPTLDRWPLENTRAFYKPMRSSSPYRTGWDREEVHLGAAVTPFGNVCLGVYGQWHHPIAGHASDSEIAKAQGVEGGFQQGGALEYYGPAVSVDLGLIISNDGLHFREPAPGFTFIGRDQELAWDRDYRDNTTADSVLLIQGSMVNTSELTFIYYCATTPTGNTGGTASNIGVATLPRDRFGCLQPIPGAPFSYLVTCPLQADDGADCIANLEIPSGSAARFSLLDVDGLETLTGYRPEDQDLLNSGLDAPVRWKGRGLPAGRLFRIRIELQGEAKMYALYLLPGLEAHG